MSHSRPIVYPEDCRPIVSSTALYVPKNLVRRIRSAGHFRNTPCFKWLSGKKCNKGDKCRHMHGSGDPCILSHLPYTSRHTNENGVHWLAVRIPLPEAMDRFFVKMGVDIKTLDSGYPLKLGGAGRSRSARLKHKEKLARIVTKVQQEIGILNDMVNKLLVEIAQTPE